MHVKTWKMGTSGDLTLPIVTVVIIYINISLSGTNFNFNIYILLYLSVLISPMYGFNNTFHLAATGPKNIYYFYHF
jgi:hypothetical protein